MDASAAGNVTDALAPAGTVSALAEAARAGDRSAEERLWERVRPWLARTALALGAPATDAADLVQDTLLAAHRHLGRFDPSRGSAKGWLATILIRRVRNGARTRARRARILGTLRLLGRRSVTRGDATAAVDARLVLGHLLRSLTERQREVVALYEIGELAADEVAEVLGITAAGVRSIARDARRALAEAARAGASRNGDRP